MWLDRDVPLIFPCLYGLCRLAVQHVQFLIPHGLSLPLQHNCFTFWGSNEESSWILLFSSFSKCIIKVQSHLSSVRVLWVSVTFLSWSPLKPVLFFQPHFKNIFKLNHIIAICFLPFEGKILLLKIPKSVNLNLSAVSPSDALAICTIPLSAHFSSWRYHLYWLSLIVFWPLF